MSIAAPTISGPADLTKADRGAAPVSGGSSTIYVSGMVGIDPKTNQLAGSTIQEQPRQALLNCESILHSAGAKLEDVVDVLVLLGRPGDFAGFNGAYGKFFPTDPPARAVGKPGVELPNGLVSIKLTAVH